MGAEGSDTQTALEAVIAADEERTKLLAEESELEASGKDLKRLAEIGDELNAIDAHSAESRAASILAGLQFSEEMQNGPTNRLSGGWRMRLALATALFKKPELLCLDEPTNHLDLDAVLWLQAYLTSTEMRATTLVVVSHDQDFLDTVCTDVLCVRQQQLDHFGPHADQPYSRYAQQAARQRVAEEKIQKLQEKQLQKLIRKQGLSKKQAEAELLKSLQRTEGPLRADWGSHRS